MKRVVINLLGKIPKGDELKGYIDWRQPLIEKAKKDYPGFHFLNPDNDLDENFPFATFGHDAYTITQCDVLLIHGVPKIGAGTAQEMLIGKYFGKPVVTVLPKNTHHRRKDLHLRCGVIKDWIHPFMLSTSDVVVETFDEALAWIENWSKAKHPIKTIKVIDDAIAAYLASDESIRLGHRKAS